MKEIELMEVNNEYADEIWAFRQEILEHDKDSDDQFAGCSGLLSSASAEAWVERCILRKDEKTCRISQVPSHTYLAIRKADNRLVGVIDLRHHIDHPILGTWGGHCGYSVRPDERGKGYATEMLRLNLINAKKLGIERLLVTCSEENTASRKTILANGGIFESAIDVEGETMERYWITIS